jgi:hypothetical protein
MNPSSSLRQSSLNRVIEAALNQQIRTLRVDANSRKVWPISDTAQPRVKLHQIEISPQKSGNHDDTRIVSSRNPKAVENRGCVQKDEFSPEQGLGPQKNIRVSSRQVLAGSRASCRWFMFARQVFPDPTSTRAPPTWQACAGRIVLVPGAPVALVVVALDAGWKTNWRHVG